MIDPETASRADLLYYLRAGRALALREQKAAAEGSLLAFVRLMWAAVEPETPFVSGWVLEAICEHLEAVTDGRLTRLLMNVPPGSTKSLVTSVFWPAWEWGPKGRPHLRYLCCAYAAHLTERDNRRFKRVIEHPAYQAFWGDRFAPQPDMYSTTQVGNDRTGWKLASSVGGVGTGERADRIIIDDPNNPQDTESELVMRTVTTWFREVMPDRLNDLSRSAIVVIQQRTHDLDVSGTIMELGLNYSILSVPMMFDVKRRLLPTDIGWLDPRAMDGDGLVLVGLLEDGTIDPDSPLAERDGELAWPERFSADALAELQKEKGSYAFCTPGYSPVLLPTGLTKRINEIQIGDEVIGWDKDHKLCKVVVSAVSKSQQSTVKLRFRHGEPAHCTPAHLWLIDEEYRSATIGARLSRIAPARHEICWTYVDVVDAVEPAGVQTVYGLTTGTGNYVVWGLASSNSAQYQMLPVPRGGGIIKDTWWQLWRDDAFPEYGTCAGSLDTAFKTGQQNDYSAMTVWAAFAHPESRKPKLMLRGAWQERLDLAALVRKVISTCREHKVDTLLIEDTARGGDVADEMYRLIGRREIRVVLVPPAGDKVSRLNATVPVFENEVVYAPDREWADLVIRQVSAFPFGRHDDLVDTVSQALIYLRKTGVATRREEFDEMETARLMYRKPRRAVYDV